jgi:hypothetical protein
VPPPKHRGYRFDAPATLAPTGGTGPWIGDDEDVFAAGQCVELYATIPSSFGGSVESGTRGIVQEVREDPDGIRFLVAFLETERLTGEGAWLSVGDLLPA